MFVKKSLLLDSSVNFAIIEKLFHAKIEYVESTSYSKVDVDNFIANNAKLCNLG